MKIKLYPKDLLEAAWRKDKKLYANGDAAEPPQCLRCGAPLAAHLMLNALSRYADVQICEACGMDEALRDAAHAPLPLTEWDAVKRGRLPAPAKGRVRYLKASCAFEEAFQHTDTPPMQLTGRPVSEVVYSRSDYDGYRWWTTWHDGPGKKPAPELVKEIDEFQNALFKLPDFKTLDTMRRFCRYAQATSEATAITKVTAMPMPNAVSSFLETPRKGQQPRNWEKMKLLVRIAPREMASKDVILI